MWPCPETARGIPGRRPHAIERRSRAALDEEQQFAHLVQSLFQRGGILDLYRRLDGLDEIDHFFLILFVNMIEQSTRALDEQPRLGYAFFFR